MNGARNGCRVPTSVRHRDRRAPCPRARPRDAAVRGRPHGACRRDRARSTAGVLVWENSWAAPFASAVVPEEWRLSRCTASAPGGRATYRRGRFIEHGDFRQDRQSRTEPPIRTKPQRTERTNVEDESRQPRPNGTYGAWSSSRTDASDSNSYRRIWRVQDGSGGRGYVRLSREHRDYFSRCCRAA
jgi:hypothetical protein